jgi:hypothetical protein
MLHVEFMPAAATLALVVLQCISAVLHCMTRKHKRADFQRQLAAGQCMTQLH